MEAHMKKCIFAMLLIIGTIIVATLPIAACWAAPWDFEVISEDGTRVFVFDAEAGTSRVYFNTPSRQLDYAIASMTHLYPSVVHFSCDMQFILYRKVRPTASIDEYLTIAFVVYAQGIPIRTVMRSEFIENHDEIVCYSMSTGPWPLIGWRIIDMSNDIVTIETDEDRTYTFDFASMEMLSCINNVYPILGIPSLGCPNCYLNASCSCFQSNPQTSNWLVGITSVGAALPIIIAVFLTKKRK